MMQAPPFPKVSTIDDCGLCCPWCAGYVEDASIRLEDLIDAHQHDALQKPERQPNGTAEPFALVVECPHCSRPSMLRLWWDMVDRVRLIPVRTDKDAALLRQAGGHE